ncbi:MAG: TonB-dependent receptor plug domain-containing protein, partial [Bacteroidota bacterium]
MISKKLFLIPFFLLAVAPTVFAQEVFGSVEDYRKDPIFGAFVSLKGTENHTHTDEFGNFKLSGVKINDTLSISLLGFKTTEAVVSDFDKGIQVKLEDQVFDLGEVVVSQTTKELNVVSTIDLRVLPVQSSQEILRKVPGLFIGQHAGGGKAEQIFLRGFDIDHGTDVNITVDGMPVNMVSHAHGQGYADLHFLIPETVQSIDYGKGPYYSQVGNFGTAGYVQFLTKDQLDNSEIKMEAGRFNTFRTVGMFKLLDEERHDAYLVSEYLISDGPFESSQNFNRLNFMGKYHARLNNGGRLSLLASHFSSEWDASGQIPVRAVESGLISNFGAIDDTEGGNTSRTNIALRYDRILNNNTFIKNSFYYSLYDFELFSNFTFFLEDPENGDQIRQVEERRLFGVESSLNYTTSIGGAATILQFGAGLRSDLVQGN